MRDSLTVTIIEGIGLVVALLLAGWAFRTRGWASWLGTVFAAVLCGVTGGLLFRDWHEAAGRDRPGGA